MRIGIMVGADGKRSTLAAVIGAVQRAEAAGFDDVWMANIFALDAIATLALAGRATRHIGLGTAVTPTYPRHPTAMAQQALTAAAAAQFHNRFYSPGNTVISVVGNVRVSDVRKDAENYLVDYKRPEPVQRARNAAENPREAARVTRSIPTNTTTIVAGFAGPGLNDPDYPAFAVLTALIGGGKSSRVFRNVRDASGLGYVVGAYTPPLARESHLLAYVEFDTNRTGPDGKKLEPAVAETMLVGTVKSVVESQPTDKEIERAKSFSIGTHALAHQRTRDRAFYLGWYELAGTGHGFDTEFPRRLAAVTRDEVVQAAKKYLNSCVVSVVQPEKR